MPILQNVPRTFRAVVSPPNQTVETLYKNYNPGQDITVTFTPDDMQGAGYKILSFSITVIGSWTNSALSVYVNGTLIRTYTSSNAANENYTWFWKVKDNNISHAIRMTSSQPTVSGFIIDARLEHG